MMKTLIVAAAVVSGCIGTTPQNSGTAPAGGARFLCVGMETSARFGECKGCEKDANRMADLMESKFGYQGEVLISERATKSAVVSKLKAGIESTPKDGLFLFFYSGHGGQEWLGGKEPDGADRQDEYLCLYDSHMMDDEVWSIVSRCKGRVFLYFDACHSATMYRSVSSDLLRAKGVAEAMSVKKDSMVKSKGFKFRPERFIKASAMSEGDSGLQGLLCWSGCKEDEYSYGGSSGGTLTTGVVMKWRQGCSYGTLWENVRSWVVRVQPGQNPVQTYVGGGFKDDMEAFR